MSVSKDLKAKQVEVIKQTIKDAKSFVVVEYEGINVADDTKLRSEFRANNVKYQVLKNRLVKRALNELGYTDFDAHLEKTSAFAFANCDELAPAKVVIENGKTIKSIKPKCGMFEGKFINANVVSQLASIPNRETLLCQLCGLLQSPMSGLARVIAEVAKKAEQA